MAAKGRREPQGWPHHHVYGGRTCRSLLLPDFSTHMRDAQALDGAIEIGNQLRSAGFGVWPAGSKRVHLTPWLIHWALTALLLWVASRLFKGLRFSSTGALVVSALLLGSEPATGRVWL